MQRREIGLLHEKQGGALWDNELEKRKNVVEEIS